MFIINKKNKIPEIKFTFYYKNVKYKKIVIKTVLYLKYDDINGFVGVQN